jgi:hypothetical protein
MAVPNERDKEVCQKLFMHYGSAFLDEVAAYRAEIQAECAERAVVWCTANVPWESDDDPNLRAAVRGEP